MSLARLGGILLLGGGAVGVALVVMALGGAGVGLGSSDPAGLLAAGCCAALGLGAGAASLSAASGYSRLTRGGLGVDAIALVSLAASASANAGPDTSPLLFVLLAALVLAGIGAIVTAVGLLRSTGWVRWSGVVLAAGCAGMVLHIATGSDLSTFLIAGIPLGFALVGLLSLVTRSDPSGAAGGPEPAQVG